MQQNQQQFGVDSFLNAVNLLYHSDDNDMKSKANKFLVDFETKVDSWDISFQVLLKDNLPEEAYYNALTILKRKINYDNIMFTDDCKINLSSYTNDPYIQRGKRFLLKFKSLKEMKFVKFIFKRL